MLARCDAAFGAEAASVGNRPAPLGVLVGRAIRGCAALESPHLAKMALVERWVQACRESSRNSRSEKLLHYLHGVIPRQCAEARASRNRGTGLREPRLRRYRCAVWRCVHKACEILRERVRAPWRVPRASHPAVFSFRCAAPGCACAPRLRLARIRADRLPLCAPGAP